VNKVRAGRKGGLRRSPRKTRAAKARFRRIALASFIRRIAENPQALDHPDLTEALDQLTELLVARKLVTLGLAQEIPS
jgi:hypothetical protein